MPIWQNIPNKRDNKKWYGKMMEITAKAIMERLNRIEESINNDAEAENIDRLTRELDIRQGMREDHAKKLLELGVDKEIISKAIGLREEYVEQLSEALKKQV